MYKIIVDKNVIKKAKKHLKPAQHKKLAEFIDALKTNPYPKPPYDLKPVKGEKTEKTNTYRFRIGGLQSILHRVLGRENYCRDGPKTKRNHIQ